MKRPNSSYNRWTWWYHFGTGDMGNDGVHDIDYTRWALGVDTHPTKVSALPKDLRPETEKRIATFKKTSPPSWRRLRQTRPAASA